MNSKPIQIKFWGVRGSTPCANAENMRYGGNTSCVQIKIPGEDALMVFDSGTGFRNLGNELNSNGNGHKGRVFITHPHWDHLQGFPFFKPFYDSDNCFRIYMPPNGDMGCEEILQGHMSKTFFPVSMDMLEADINCVTTDPAPIDFGTYQVEYMWAVHTVPTAIYKLTVGEITIVYAPDNEIMLGNRKDVIDFREEFVEFIQGADILMHDSQYNSEEYKDRIGWGHSAWEVVVELAEKANVKRLCLIHHDPDKDDDILDEVNTKIQKKFASKFEHISLAKEGQAISIDPACPFLALV
ncbi:MAG: MBL fold metallo-hydrolase [Gracilimonas sp.]|nr:MBL fold metallo-hydrolase [Gracilimonas sp.]